MNKKLSHAKRKLGFHEWNLLLIANPYFSWIHASRSRRQSYLSLENN